MAGGVWLVWLVQLVAGGLQGWQSWQGWWLEAGVAGVAGGSKLRSGQPLGGVLQQCLAAACDRRQFHVELEHWWLNRAFPVAGTGGLKDNFRLTW